MFWGGDTARQSSQFGRKGYASHAAVLETISLGSSFRFQDLKTVLYEDERAEPLVLAGKRAPVQPAVFELAVNYRSHGGIVDCASSIISLISKLFPYSIDELRPETAVSSRVPPECFLSLVYSSTTFQVVHGPLPCVFRGFENGVFHFEQFLFGGELVPPLFC